jgi:uncharacterized protein (TIGR00369 family)
VSSVRSNARQSRVDDDRDSDDLARNAAAGDPAALDAYLASLKDRVFVRGVHLGSHLGIEVIEVVSDRVTMRMPWRRELRRGGGIFHGGAIMALADHVAGCLFNTDPRIAAAHATGLTTDFNVSFFRAAERGEAIVATGIVLRRGRNITFMQIDVCSEVSGRPVATCRATYLTVPRARVAPKGRG